MDERDAALGRAWRDERPRRLLRALTELPERFGGHEGERRAADRIADALADAGLCDVRQSTFEVPVWTRGGSTLTVERAGEERPVESVALPYSPAASVRGPLVDAGYGTPAELDDAEVGGAIVVASTQSPPGERHRHRMEKVGHAAEAGAAGFVFANHVPGQLAPTGALNPDAALPSVGVSREAGERLRTDAADGLVARLAVDATTESGESQNVRATLGPDTDEAVFLVAHYDAHDVGEGALDNGCGVAVVAGALRVLTALRDDLSRRVEVAAVGCEELGLYGSAALADRVPADDVHALVNVDGAGRHRNLRALTHCSSDTRRVVEQVADDLAHPVETEGDPHPYSDHWHFLRRGVPTVQLHSADPDAGDRWDRGWTHTSADTLDKVDARTVREHAMVTALVVDRLAGAAIDRVDPATVRESLAAGGAKPGMQAAGVWPAVWE